MNAISGEFPMFVNDSGELSRSNFHSGSVPSRISNEVRYRWHSFLAKRGRLAVCACAARASTLISV